MKTFDPALLAALEAEDATFFYLVWIDFFSGRQYYTDADMPIYHEGQRYLPVPMQVGSPRLGTDMSVDSVPLRFDNTGLWFSALLMAADPAGREVLVSFAPVDANRQLIGVATFFRGYVDAVDIGEETARLTVASEKAFWRKKSLRRCQPSCPWPFAQTECGYTGSEADCNQTWDRCEELGNTARFGGCRFLPAIQKREIWWGRQSK